MEIQIIESSENATKNKIIGFSNLEKGWHFGEGIPPTEQVLHVAANMSERVALSGFRSNAFPGVNGEIMVTAYHGKNYLEFTFETDGTVTFVRENGNAEIAYEEGLTVDQAKRRLDTFGAEKIWKNSSGLFTETTMTQQEESSKALPSKIHQDQAYQLFLSHASMNMETQRAPIFTSIMNKSHQPQSSFGLSRIKLYLMTALSLNIQTKPEMSAMAI